MKFQFTDEKCTSELSSGTLHVARDNISGFRPFQLLVASIATCSGFVFQQIYKKQRMEVEDFSISASIVRNEEETNRVEEVHLTFHLKGKELNEQKLQRNLEMTHKHCSMIQSVDTSIKVYKELDLQ